MLTIKQLLRYVDKERHSRATKEVSVSGIKKARLKRNGNPIIKATTSTLYDHLGNKKRKVEKHQTSVELLLAEGATKSKMYVKVSCDCAFHTFNCEYALHKQGAADIKYSNGEPPKMKNTSLVPMTCIHTIALLNEVAF